MATYSGANAVTATLTAATVDTVILTKPTLNGVTVLSDSGSAAVFFTVSNLGGPNTQPIIDGANCDTLPATIGSVTVPIISHNGVVVNLISSGTPQYTVAIL